LDNAQAWRLFRVSDRPPTEIVRHVAEKYGINRAQAAEWTERFVDGRNRNRSRPRRAPATAARNLRAGKPPGAFVQALRAIFIRRAKCKPAWDTAANEYRIPDEDAAAPEGVESILHLIAAPATPSTKEP
jgi:hypothetical protein